MRFVISQAVVLTFLFLFEAAVGIKVAAGKLSFWWFPFPIFTQVVEPDLLGRPSQPKCPAAGESKRHATIHGQGMSG